MKRPCILLAALLPILCAGVSRAASPALVQWRADLSSTEVRNLYLRHGDSATLTARLYLRGAPYTPTNAVCYFQTNGMGRAWWTAPCSIASNTVSVAWTPLLERAGSDLYPLVVRVDDAAWRAAALLFLRPAPGPEPDELPVILDFGSIAYTNAPWATAQEAVRASSEAIYDAVTVIDSGHVDTVAEIRDTLLGLIEQLKRINTQPGDNSP